MPSKFPKGFIADSGQQLPPGFVPDVGAQPITDQSSIGPAPSTISRAGAQIKDLHPIQAVESLTDPIENYTQEGRAEHPVLSRIGDMTRGAKDLASTVGPELMTLAPEVAAPDETAGLAAKIAPQIGKRMLGATAGATTGGFAGYEMGRPFGLGETGGKIGTVAGGALGFIDPELPGKVFRGWKGTSKVAPAVEAASDAVPSEAEAGSLGKISTPSESGVAHIPEPRPLMKGEKPGLMNSVPREQLADLAKSGKPGAGAQLSQLGAKQIYIPRGAEIEAPDMAKMRSENFGSGKGLATEVKRTLNAPEADATASATKAHQQGVRRQMLRRAKRQQEP